MAAAATATPPLLTEMAAVTATSIAGDTTNTDTITRGAGGAAVRRNTWNDQ